ncbi:uncharacterized protein LOC112182303 isoform X1 [Rosa chinensis]|uniref:uncharacterized protein LOC112182303 isoform X1 n=2 Tax=Rosa chinensis TaxID=74649 RepID=UPI000D090204|nr:uncharacterized protein LOC112182303 isoform X1 [Rosa chinensis]XP_040363465.1 uncharacterized protein LOC112182303 isoform X1 [Rosa chinensis]XP_040363493.1 uncharacterized protein LOC112182303 isoform X1 [Rosa chinensis]
MMTLLGHCDNIFIPLITTEDYHYTMLRLNKKAKEWIHYNPMRKRTNPEKSKGYENAKEVVEAVTMWMLDVKKLHKQNKERRLKFVRVEKKTTIYEEIQIDENAEKTIAWINKTDVDNLKLVEDMYCAQQPDNSLDCGPYILHYIENIAKNRLQISKADRGVLVDKVLGLEREIKESLKNMRRTMVERFLNHDEGWYSKVGYTQ